MNDIDHEGWHATHAQLLKSVADAQAKLLAAQNETNDRLESQAKEILGLNETLHRIRDRLDAFTNLGSIFNQLRDGQTLAHKDLQAGVMSLQGKLEALQPRRQVERLRIKRIVKQRKQRR